ncbi:polyphosphate kinase 2 family protein [Roseiarcus sp.]|uniref:polyphosphate kinase 2 family protein n=1 Tax=Roseiarcus sp. TaxID=1969460 RepID=UPI003F96469F
MKTADFVVSKRPRLSDIQRFPKVDFVDYERRLEELQETLQRIQQAYLGTPQRAVVVLEGWDTAGKGGVVRRLGWALDPRSFKVHSISAPTGREKSLHYLQRFWERLPQHGQIVVFDRSWYGRVMVERVEGFATPAEWRRAYDEIKDFERMLIADDTRLIKLFLHITPDEQLRRFRSRLTDPLKRWKLSYEDFRNRAHRREYEEAIEDMMHKTSTRQAPWHLIPANDKPYGRLAALRIMVDRLSKNVPLDPRPLDPKVLEAAERLLGVSVPANGSPSKKKTNNVT